jgi:hypothetical protein
MIDKMIELVDKYTLIKGETYYVKRKNRFRHSRHIKNFDCIFDGYNKEFEDFVWVKMSNVLDIELALDLNEFYRYVTKEEYYAKLKEKYDGTCLNIILKRLVDESFVW